VAKPRRSQSRTRRTVDRISHLHVVIDDELHDKITAHARKLEGISARTKTDHRPNLSAAVRDLLRSACGLPGVEAA